VGNRTFSKPESLTHGDLKDHHEINFEFFFWNPVDLIEQSKYYLRLLGAFQLVAPNGCEIRLGRKAQAILAILATEPGAPVTRNRLQDMLWSLAGPKHGRDSLKKSLQSIRKALGEDSDSVIVRSGDRVWLDSQKVRIDLYEPSRSVASRAFLEGLDIPDPEFDDWLREMRQRLTVDVVPRPEALITMPVVPAPATRIRLAIRAQSIVGTQKAALVGEVLLSRVVDTLSQSGLLEVCDLRDVDQQSLGAADAVLYARTVSVGDEVQVQLAVRGSSNNAMIWSDSRYFASGSLGGNLLNEAVSRFADEILFAAGQLSKSTGQEESIVTRLAMEGIENLFRLAPENIEKAAKCFAQAIEIEPRGNLYAWYAFLTPFRYEQQKGIDLIDLRGQADQIVRRALELDPYNPMVRGLVAHVYSFLFRDFERADAALSPLRGQPPNAPMYHFSESMLHLYSGKPDQARRYAMQALRGGESHPFAFAFSTSLCMIDALGGEAGSAIAHGRRALGSMPTSGRVYEPTLRYLTAAYARAGRVDEARQSWSDLQLLNPANNLEQMRDSCFPIAAEHMRTSLNDAYGAIARTLS